MIVRQEFCTDCESIQTLSTYLQNSAGFVLMNYPTTKVIGLFPKWQAVSLSSSSTVLLERHGLQQSTNLQDADYFSVLNQYWNGSRLKHSYVNESSNGNFYGGLMGFIGYDLAASQAITLENLASPAAIMGEYDIFLKLEVSATGKKVWQLYGPNLPELQVIYQHIQELLAELGIRNTTHPVFQLNLPFQPVWQLQQYQYAFNKIQNYLKQGDCYQVNLTQPFKATVEGSLVSTIDTLMHLTKASYGGFIKYGDFELLSCSPELFIEFNVDGEVITKPIKGTRPRHLNPEIDEALKQQLLHSEKDRSENLMIVDLLRNDLSVYAQTGSVHVPALFKIESFAQVHHLVSEIRAKLKPEASPLDVLFNAMPGGSITGAPKIRAMQIIDELEAESRGAYCGSMGFLNYDGTGTFNILIRSLQKRGNTLTAWAGGGITIASNCEEEYQECLDKIGAILNCVNGFSVDCQAQDN